MASYRMSVQIIGRSKGKNAVAAAAYRSGEKLLDIKSETIKDYTHKDNINYCEILTPEGAEWAKDREQLWNTVEGIEKRINSQLAREIQLSMPVELKPEENRKMVLEFVQTNFVERYGIAADCCFHNEDGHNPHVHVMLTTRRVTEKGLAEKARDMNSVDELKNWRGAWAHTQNREFERLGISAQVDHRSFEAQGIDKIAGVHIGPAGQAIEKREPGQSVLVQMNTDIADMNSTKVELAEVEAAIRAMGDELREIRLVTEQARKQAHPIKEQPAEASREDREQELKETRITPETIAKGIEQALAGYKAWKAGEDEKKQQQERARFEAERKEQEFAERRQHNRGRMR